MHIYTLSKWQHDHDYGAANQSNERKTLQVVLLTSTMMVLEIAAGALFGSMALLADGWHMSTHAAALGITLFAYRYSRRHASNPHYTFGTGKIGVLGGFTSAIVLQIVAILMMFEAARRIFEPRPIQFGEAIGVAILGLVVNLVSVRLLGDDHKHADHDDEDGDQSEHHHHEDHNLKAAYLHVLADTLTSILAITALLAGSFLGWIWLDAMMGIVGGAVITKWAVGLLRETSQILLDGRADEHLVTQVRSALENEADTRLTDLHIWHIGENNTAAIISLVTHYPRPVEHYRNLLNTIPTLKHVTIEIHECKDEPCLPVNILEAR